jgi:acetolactate synthase I/II/III large subunit
MEQLGTDEQTAAMELASTDDAAISTTLSGGEAIAKMLGLAGAGPGFGMGGFQLLPFYDAARRNGLVHHLINDERTGGFAADA